MKTSKAVIFATIASLALAASSTAASHPGNGFGHRTMMPSFGFRAVPILVERARFLQIDREERPITRERAERRFARDRDDRRFVFDRDHRRFARLIRDRDDLFSRLDRDDFVRMFAFERDDRRIRIDRDDLRFVADRDDRRAFFRREERLESGTARLREHRQLERENLELRSEMRRVASTTLPTATRQRIIADLAKSRARVVAALKAQRIRTL